MATIFAFLCLARCFTLRWITKAPGVFDEWTAGFSPHRLWAQMRQAADQSKAMCRYRHRTSRRAQPVAPTRPAAIYGDLERKAERGILVRAHDDGVEYGLGPS
jgi:hypothetical protein